MLFILIPIAWLAIAAVVVSVCRMAAHGERSEPPVVVAARLERTAVSETVSNAGQLAHPAGERHGRITSRGAR